MRRRTMRSIVEALLGPHADGQAFLAGGLGCGKSAHDLRAMNEYLAMHKTADEVTKLVVEWARSRRTAESAEV